MRSSSRRISHPSIRLIVAFAIAAILTAGLISFTLPVEGAQDLCPDIPSGGNLATLDEFATSESACQTQILGVPPLFAPQWQSASSDLIPGGAFLKTFKYVLLDGHAQSSGTCQVRLLDGQGGCLNDQLQLRYVVKIVTQTETPTGLTSTHNNFPIKPNGSADQRYDVDSRQVGTTNLGTWRTLLGFEGKNEIRWQSVINKTACNIEPGFSPLKQTDVNVVKCRPVWNLAGGGPGGGARTLHLPPGAISIYVPPSLSGLNGPIDQAIQDVNNRMSPTVTVTRVTSPCGTGGNCVNVEEGAVPTGTCASSTTGVPNAAGEATTPGRIVYPPVWPDRDASRNRRTAAHELGHLLGLGHQTSCAIGDSVMSLLPNPPPPTDPCRHAISGLALGPTVTDGAAMRNSTYAGGNQKTCGF